MALVNHLTLVGKSAGEGSCWPADLPTKVRRAKRAKSAPPGQGGPAHERKKCIPYSTILPKSIETQQVGYIVGTSRKIQIVSPTNKNLVVGDVNRAD